MKDWAGFSLLKERVVQGRAAMLERASVTPRWWTILLSISVLFLWTGCSKLADEGKVRIGGHTTQLGACLKIAEAQGLYKQHGLEGALRYVESSKQSMAAMEAGDLDVVIASLAAGTFNMIQKGDAVILADGSRVVPSVIIRKDLWEGGQIRQLADLKGRSFSSPREGSSSYYAVSRILAGFGLTMSDVKPKYLDDREALAALEAKQVDVAVLNEPDATLAVRRGIGVRYNLREIEKFFPPNGQQHMVICTLRKTLREKPQLLRRFLAAYVEAAQFYDQARNGRQLQRAEAVKIIAGYTKSEPGIVDESVWPYVSPDGKPDVSYIQEMHDYFLKQKLVDAPVNLADVIHLELLPEKK